MAADASTPSAAADGQNNVFITWAEGGKIYLSKYDAAGNCLVGSGEGNGGVACPVGSPSKILDTALASTPSIAVDPSGNVLVTWYHGSTVSGTVLAQRCNNSLTSCTVVYNPSCSNGQGSQAVSCPPAWPPNVQAAMLPTVATDKSGSIVAAWQANVNDPTQAIWNAFARSFDSTLMAKKNDFRVDLTPRAAAARSVGVARARSECVGGANQNRACRFDSDCPGSTCQSSGRFPYAWRDNRDGSYNIYTRVVPSLD